MKANFSAVGTLRIVAAALCALLTQGCGDDAQEGSIEPLVALEDFGSFYEPPDPLPGGRPGDLIRVQAVQPLAPGSRAWRVLYRSVSALGEPIAVSGLVAAPAAQTANGRRDIVSWAHGTKGVNDPCAPSRGYSFGNHDFFAIAPELLAEGWVAVASDFEGLGTPGVHPYLVSVSEARGQLDLVRAAQQIPETRASGRFSAWGRSQGGHASLAAAEIAREYAPELELVGVVSAAPAGDMVGIFLGSAVLNLSFNWLAAAGIEAAWDFPLEAFYAPDAMAALRRLLEENQECGFSAAIRDRGGVGFTGTIDETPGGARLLELLELSSVGTSARIDVPVLLSQGTADGTVPKALTDVLVGEMCALGTNVEYLENEGESHNDSSALHMAEFRTWTRARFEGLPARGCRP